MQLQFGCIQTILENNGRFLCYRGSLPISKEFAPILEKQYSLTKVGKRYYYMPECNDFDRLWNMLDKVRLLAIEFKIAQLSIKYISIDMHLEGYH